MPILTQRRRALRGCLCVFAHGQSALTWPGDWWKGAEKDFSKQDYEVRAVVWPAPPDPAGHDPRHRYRGLRPQAVRSRRAIGMGPRWFRRRPRAPVAVPCRPIVTSTHNRAQRAPIVRRTGHLSLGGFQRAAARARAALSCSRSAQRVPPRLSQSLRRALPLPRVRRSARA